MKTLKAALVVIATFAGLSCEKPPGDPTAPEQAKSTPVTLYSPTFDAREFSTARFQVDYVEPPEIPPITDLPKFVPRREDILMEYQAAADSGTSESELLQFRKRHFQVSAYPILVSDTQTGNTYELQDDRRTIVARRPNGQLIWVTDPFFEARLEPYRVEHPYIHFIGENTKSSRPGKPVLGVEFISSQYGDVDMETGRFQFHGQN